MFSLDKREHLLLIESKRAIQEKKKIYIYGCGEIGRYVCDFLLYKKIPVDGFLVDSTYYKEDMVYKNVGVFCAEEAQWDNNALVFVAIQKYEREKIIKLTGNARIIEIDVLSVHFLDDMEAMSWDSIQSNQEKWMMLYGSLADEKSKRCLIAYLNQRISGDFSYLETIWDSNQYCDKDLVDFKKIETVVDCGAYIGDSYQLFKKNYREAVGKEFTGKAFLLEPDEVNYRKLCLNCTDDKNCVSLKMGAWDRKERLSFSASGIASGVSEGGEEYIDVDKIDSMVGEEKVDYIKMDIEGSELKALCGAAETITKHHPILAICVYHRKDDLLSIPRYIYSMCQGYKFYLRAYSRFTQELVLYAVPETEG